MARKKNQAYTEEFRREAVKGSEKSGGVIVKSGVRGQAAFLSALSSARSPFMNLIPIITSASNLNPRSRRQ